jgi:PAT family beta-lactamase induction signal transducer AmpG
MMIKRLFVVFFLGFSSGLPLALLTGTLQAWFATSGASLLLVGMLSLISLPYNYRFLWAPLLDHYPLTQLGRRRSWMLLTQILLLVGFNCIVWFSPNTSPHWIIFMATLLACCSATQDVAVDAQRAELLTDNEKSLGLALANLGYRVALIAIGGGSLIMAHHYGWIITYRVMGACMFIGLLTTWWSDEPVVATVENTWPTDQLKDSFILPWRAFLAQPRLGLLLSFVLCYKLGEAFTASTSGVVMPFLIQGIGFPLHVIAYVNKIAGMLAAIAGSLLSGVLLMRWPLYKGLCLFGLLQWCGCLLFIALAYVGYNLPLFCVAVVCENFASGLCSVALVTLFMRLVDKRYTATQLAILIAVAFLPRTFSGPIAGLLQPYVGWVGFYMLVSVGALLFLPLLRKLDV